MVVSDPIADMLTRIRNAVMVRHETVAIPASRMRLALAKILKEEGFITDFEVIKAKPQRLIKVHLRYMDRTQPAVSGLERVSKPGLRVYVGHDEIPRLYGGLGLAILSTPKGVMTGPQARRQKIGGELLCYVW